MPSMRLKSYFCATVEAAMEMARKELGEDALLVHARPSTAATRSLGALEVVFGLPAGNAPAKPVAAKTVPAKTAPAKNVVSHSPAAVPSPVPFLAAGNAGRIDFRERASGPQVNRTEQPRSSVLARANGVPEADPLPGASTGDVARDLANLRREMERISQTLRATADGGASGPASSLSPPAELPAFYRRLLAGDLAPSMAKAVAEGAQLEDFVEVDATLGCTDSGSPAGSSSVAGLASAAGLTSDAASTSHVGLSFKDARPDLPVIVALVGPPGAGKTTTLIKLAARYGLAARRSTHILSADVERIAAADQLRVLAAILGMGCTVVETARSLAQAIEEHRHKDFIFIDTPGFAASESEQAAELAAFFAGNSAIDTHLVLSASMRGADLARATAFYEIFRPSQTAVYQARRNASLRRAGQRIGPLRVASVLPLHGANHSRRPRTGQQRNPGGTHPRGIEGSRAGEKSAHGSGCAEDGGRSARTPCVVARSVPRGTL